MLELLLFLTVTIVNRVFAVIAFAAVAAGGTAAPGGSQSQAQGNFPVPESRPFLIDQFHPVAGMGLMTGTAGTPFAPIGHMKIMKILFAIAKIRINSGIRKAQEVRFMAGKAEIVGSIPIGSIKRFRIAAGQQTRIFGSVGLVAGGTAALGQGAMKMFFPHYLGSDIFQRFGFTGIIPAMTAQAEIHFLLLQQSRLGREMGGMAVTATIILIECQVFYL